MEGRKKHVKKKQQNTCSNFISMEGLLKKGLGHP